MSYLTENCIKLFSWLDSNNINTLYLDNKKNKFRSVILLSLNLKSIISEQQEILIKDLIGVETAGEIVIDQKKESK